MYITLLCSTYKCISENKNQTLNEHYTIYY